MLQPHTIKPAHGATHRSKVVGRGNASGHGTTAGRGGKGQTARSGGSRGLKLKAFKQFMQSVPKLRGFHSIATKPAEVYLSDLEQKFSAGDTITVAALKAKNLVGANVKAAKVVGTGELKKKLIVKGLLTTTGAAEKILAAGGTIEK